MTQANVTPTPHVSNLTYEPPPAPEASELDDFAALARDSISEIENEFAAEGAPEFTDEELADEGEAEVEPEDTAEPKVDKDDKDDPAIARGMERLVAREVELQTKERDFAAREARVMALEQELAQWRAKQPAQEMLEDLDFRPTEAIKALGKDPRMVVRLMIAEQLEAEGKEVPAELREAIRDAKYTREMADLKRQLAQKSRAEQDMMEYSAIVLGAREHAKTLVGSKDAPTLADLAKSDPEAAHLEIMEEIQKDARVRMATEPNGKPISYAEATARAEKRLAKLKTMFAPKNDTATTPVDASKKKAVPPQPKAPAKPLPPWKTREDDIYKQGIDEAVREYHLQEAKAKRAVR